MNRVYITATLIVLFITGCGKKEVQPVEIYPEDNCSHCRMTVSEKAYASEIIAENGDVMKFDDLQCLEQYRKKNPALKIAAIFVTDFESKQWLRYEQSVIVKTGLQSPMGSGKVAVKDSARAKELSAQYPPSQDVSENEGACCN